MATYTINYHLAKPDSSDIIDVTVLNSNFDTIDQKIKEAADAIPAVATLVAAGIVKPDGLTVTVDNDGTIHIPIASLNVAGLVKPDGTSITIDNDGTIHGAQTYVLPTATGLRLGGIKVGSELSVAADGTLSVNIVKDNVPTANSDNVPKSGGTYAMIDLLNTQVNTLSANVTALTTGLTWKAAVATQSAIATTYPSPSVGWTVMCLDTGYAYQWDGSQWAFVFASTVAVASASDVLAVLELS